MHVNRRGNPRESFSPCLMLLLYNKTVNRRYSNDSSTGNALLVLQRLISTPRSVTYGRVLQPCCRSYLRITNTLFRGLQTYTQWKLHPDKSPFVIPTKEPLGKLCHGPRILFQLYAQSVLESNLRRRPKTPHEAYNTPIINGRSHKGPGVEDADSLSSCTLSQFLERNQHR